MKKACIYFWIIVLLISVGIANATPIQWLESEGGNGNSYDVINVTLSWPDAKLAAEALGGHLVTITSAEENAWLTQQFGYGLDKIFWIGAYQLTGSPEPAGGWTWVTDEVFNFTNWCCGGAPNNGGDSPNEWAATLFYTIHPVNGTTWNDVNGFGTEPGYILEVENSAPIPEPTTAVSDFVTRFYQECLGREPDAPGLDGWVNALIDGSLSGADVANNFIFSPEFINRNKSNEGFVIILYRAFFDREPDTGGYSGWVNLLYTGESRQVVLDGFIYSVEFENLCDSYGINPYPGSSELVEDFVTRFYQQCLNREPDQPGLDGWVNALLNGTLCGANVANAFIFSPEFINRNTSNENFLTILYRAFFNREPDTPGYNGHLNGLKNNGVSRQAILNGFIYSIEFENLCNAYGIAPYSA